MDNSDKAKIEKEIVAKYGIPEYDKVSGQPVNESAKKLREFRLTWGQEQAKLRRAKALISEHKALRNEIKSPLLPVNEDVLDNTWLVGFTDTQRAIVIQWMLDINQSNKAIAEKVGCDTKEVRTLKTLEQFKKLYRKLAESVLDQGILPAAIGLVQLATSSQPNSKLQASIRILIDRGLLKDKEVSETGTNELTLSPELMDELRKKGDQQV